MLLKIEGKDVWRYIGGVEEFEHRTIMCETEEYLDEMRKNCDMDYTSPWEAGANSVKIQWLSYLKEGYDWAVILYQGKAFLLNEETGKTIERF